MQYGISFLAAGDNCTSSPPAPIDVLRTSSASNVGKAERIESLTACWSLLPFAFADCGLIPVLRVAFFVFFLTVFVDLCLVKLRMVLVYEVPAAV